MYKTSPTAASTSLSAQATFVSSKSAAQTFVSSKSGDLRGRESEGDSIHPSLNPTYSQAGLQQHLVFYFVLSFCYNLFWAHYDKFSRFVSIPVWTHTHTQTHTHKHNTHAKARAKQVMGTIIGLLQGTCMHACIHTYTHTYIHICMHTYIHTHTHTHAHTHTHTQHRELLFSPALMRQQATAKDWHVSSAASPFLPNASSPSRLELGLSMIALRMSPTKLCFSVLSLSLPFSLFLSLSLAFSLSLSLFHSLKNKNKDKNKTSLRDNQDCFLEGPDVFQVPKCKCLRANIENLAYKTREYTHTRAHIHTFMHACARTHAALDHARACKHTEDDNTFDVQFESIMLCFHCLTSHKKENENLVYIGPPKHQGANCKALYLCLICMPYMWYERTCQSCLSLQADGNHCIICMYVLYVCLIFMPLRMTYMTWNDLYDLKALAKAALSLVSGNSGLQFPISCLKLQC